MAHLVKAMRPLHYYTTKAVLANVICHKFNDSKRQYLRISKNESFRVLNQQLHVQNQKLVNRISKNIYDETQKHREAHRVLEMQQFKKTSSVFTRSVHNPLQMCIEIDSKFGGQAGLKTTVLV